MLQLGFEPMDQLQTLLLGIYHTIPVPISAPIMGSIFLFSLESQNAASCSVAHLFLICSAREWDNQGVCSWLGGLQAP